MNRRIKILQLQPDYNVKRNDFADLAEQIVLALEPGRFEVVSAFLCGRPGADEPTSRAERSVYFEFSDSQLKGMRIAALRRLYRFCRDEAFDVVICNRFKPISMMLWLNRWLRVPVCIGITHVLNDFNRVYRRWQVLGLADRRWRFVGVSPAVRQALLDARCGFHADNTFAITNAIDVEKADALQMSREDARAQLGLAAEATTIGAIGRLVPVKGHATLLRAFAQVAREFPSAQLMIIGEGRERAHLEALAAELGLAGRVHLPGARPEALRFMRAFDIFVMPSLQEALGLALMEGMSGRRPIIGSDIPAMRSLIQGGKGTLVPPGDVPALAGALRLNLSLPPAERVARGQAAHEYLRAHHGIAEYRRAYRALVERSLEQSLEDRP